MTDYKARSRRSPAKAAAYWLLTRRPVNAIAVGMLGLMPDSNLRARIPVIGKTVSLLVGGHQPVVLTGIERCDLAREVYWGQGHLRGAADRLSLELALKLSADADLFLDIGAYTGVFALAAARNNPKITAHAYEIVPENFQLLWANVIANDLVGRVVPRLHGVGAERGSVEVPASLGSGILASSVALDSEARDGVTIPVSPLDELHAGFSGTAVAKIDVEGFEYSVLRGAEKFIGKTRPDIICEVLRRAPNIPEMESFLGSYGYRIYHITENGVQHASRISPSRVERDWLFSLRAPSELDRLGVPMVSL
jgi:FkbM family methyltransferase